jgi:tetratricopeptide (TPR) repeat protein
MHAGNKTFTHPHGGTGFSSDLRHTHDVFISYAHLDAEHDVANARLIATWLEAEGYDVWWDSSIRFARVLTQLQQKVLSARHVLVLWSHQAAKSEWVLRECRWADEQNKLAPVILDDCPLPPKWEKEYLWLRLRDFESQKSELRSKLGPPTVIPRIETLPSAARLFVGRKDELATLRTAWASTADNADPARKTNVLVFHAIGGAGKSALLHEFLYPAAGESFSGAVHSWSAYSQGSGDNRTANADEFIASALKRFGHDLQENPIRDPVEKGRQLARLVSQHCMLVILDGLEPLQDAPHINGGRLRDRALAEFIKVLARENRGLLVINSRQELPELEAFAAPRVISTELNRMNLTDGVMLLSALGVHGPLSRMKETADNLHGHALSLNLLGSYLRSAHNGDIHQAEQFRLGEKAHADANFAGDATVPYAKRAARIIEGHVARLGETDKAVLNMAGLFDRPADREALEVLLAGPAIRGLTEAFQDLPAPQRQARWNVAVDRLRQLKLLLAEDRSQPGALDAHPIVRTHFGARLKENEPQTFRDAHNRLYDFYRLRGLPEEFREPESYAVLALAVSYPEDINFIKRSIWQGRIPPGLEGSVGPVWNSVRSRRFAEAARLLETDLFYETLAVFQPSSLADMQPAFAAITHGCAAGRHQEALSEVYSPRIARGNQNYLMSSAGAPNVDLSLVAQFFETLWSVPAKGLNDRSAAHQLAGAALALRSLGRFREAMEPFETGLKADIEMEQWRNAALASSNISELRLILGDLAGAIKSARKGVEFSDISGDPDNPWMSRVALADALHQSGQAHGALEEFQKAEELHQSGQVRGALALFQKAEALHAETVPDAPRFSSVWGYYYCDLLLGMGQTQNVVERASNALQLYEKYDHTAPLDLALDHLTLGRAYTALSALTKPGNQKPRGRLASLMGLWTAKGKTDGNPAGQAQTHLDEALNGLRRAGAEEFLVRGLLARAAFWRTEGVHAAASDDLDAALDIISRGEMRLPLADFHLEAARLALAQFTGGDIAFRTRAEASIQEAAKLISVIGYGRRRAELAALNTCLTGGIPASILAPDRDAQGRSPWRSR